jgi:hypothetical protein
MGGSENNNAVVDAFIQRSQVGIHKVIAQKDVDFSNLTLPPGRFNDRSSVQSYQVPIRMILMREKS